MREIACAMGFEMDAVVDPRVRTGIQIGVQTVDGVREQRQFFRIIR